MSQPRFAITLGASFLGYATHAGFLARLHELGIRPTHVGGSSAGAIAAGLYAAGLDQQKIREVVTSWSFRQSFISRTPWFRQFTANTFHSAYPAPFKSTAAVDYLEQLFGDLQIEALKNPSFLTAVTDIDHRQGHFRLVQRSLRQIARRHRQQDQCVRDEHRRADRRGPRGGPRIPGERAGSAEQSRCHRRARRAGEHRIGAAVGMDRAARARP